MPSTLLFLIPLGPHHVDLVKKIVLETSLAQMLFDALIMLVAIGNYSSIPLLTQALDIIAEVLIIFFFPPLTGYELGKCSSFSSLCH